MFSESRQTLETIGDKHAIAASLHVRGVFEFACGQPVEARKLLGTSLAIREEIKDNSGIASSAHELARIELAQGNTTEARRLLQRSLQVAELTGDKANIGSSLHDLARIETFHGNFHAARSLLIRSIPIVESTGDQHMPIARQYYERALAIAEQIGDINSAAVVRGNLAFVEAFDGNFIRSRELASTSILQLEEIGSPQVENVRELVRQIDVLKSRTNLVLVSHFSESIRPALPVV